MTQRAMSGHGKVHRAGGALTGPSFGPRRNALLLFALATVLALGTGCPHNDPPVGDAGSVADASVEPPDSGVEPPDSGVEPPDSGVEPPDSGVEPPDAGSDAGVPDASVACVLPDPEDPGAPWASRCDSPVVDRCAALVLPEAGPVPTEDRWCEESAQRLCAAGVDAGTLEPTSESECAARERKTCESRFPRSRREAGSLTYWPQAASACLTGELKPSSPACGCAFVGSSPGGVCGEDAHCRTGYCLKDSSDAGVCVACPDKRPVGSACGRFGDAPCDDHGNCSQGCCAPRPNAGEACKLGLNPRYCDPDTSPGCRPLAIEDTSGIGTCRAYKQQGETCGPAPVSWCTSIPVPACDLGTCVDGQVCTLVSPDASVARQCQPEGLRCDSWFRGCGPNQGCTGPSGRCVTLGTVMEGEECNGSGRGLCAEGLRCVVRPDAGTAPFNVCAVANPGECRFDVECPWAQLCRNGVCADGKALGEACNGRLDCAAYLICTKGVEDGGTCVREPRLAERCRFTEPDGGLPEWVYSCLEGTCDSTTGLCQ
ncbi:hypothetical protein D7V97_12535 [Corallococcus sp. CA053C]|nr:hypothetical protein D7V97_12535 [Corallococcus sp. CA053C]